MAVLSSQLCKNLRFMINRRTRSRLLQIYTRLRHKYLTYKIATSSTLPNNFASAGLPEIFNKDLNVVQILNVRAILQFFAFAKSKHRFTP